MFAGLALGKRITLAVGTILVLLIALGGIAQYSVFRTETALESLVADSLPGIYETGMMADAVGHLRALTLMHSLSADAGQKAQFRNEIAKREESFRQGMSRYEKTITTAADRELFGKIGPAFEAYTGSIHSVLELSDQLKTQEAGQLYITEARPRVLTLIQAINAEVDYNKKLGDRNSAETTSAAATAKAWIWTVLLLSICLGGGVATIIVRGANRELHTVARELSESAEQITAAASQVASSSQSLARGASDQAKSLVETSASTEEVNAMARKNTDSSASAAELLTRSQEKVSEANRSLDAMVSAMGEISDSSAKISKIIKVIDEIAFQTNILALNAAVEAARAGEAGMGFAVVADEVRSLAQRCAQAAKETAGLIEESIANSEKGKSRVGQVAEVIQAITGEGAQVKTLSEEVSQGSREQARGIEQVARSITQLEQVTQHIAAGAEEGASAAEELDAQAGAMRTVVGKLLHLVGTGA